jgi:hypothetical protein
MAATTVWPLLQAVVQKLRADTALQAVLIGGEHEGVAITGTKFPWLTYQLGYAPRDRFSDSVLSRVGIYVHIHSRDQVEARNLDQLVMNVLDNATFDFAATEHGSSGQYTLRSHRILDLSNEGTDDEGRKVYSVGGLYEIWIDQPS